MMLLLAPCPPDPEARGHGAGGVRLGSVAVFYLHARPVPLDFLGALGQGKARHVRARKGGVQESGSDEQGEAFGLG